MLTQTIPLLRRVDLQGAGGIPWLVDLRRTGSKDLLVLQAPGMYWNWLNMPMNHGKENQQKLGFDHFCLTALSEGGEQLWQIGTPWNQSMPFWSHSAERSLTLADMDGDGRLELLVLRQQSILVVDPSSGRIVAEHDLPQENIEILCAGRTGPGARDWTIFAGVSNQGRAGSYGNPGYFLDTDLRVLETRDYFGAGHAPQACDVDGDGLDEFIIGYELIDHDLTTKWVFRDFGDIEYDAGEMHVDAMDVGTFKSGDPPMIAYAASTRQYVVDMHGQLVWKADRTHPQQCFFGAFGAGKPQQNQLFVLNKRAELDLFDSDGSVIWSITPQDCWPLGKPHPFEQGHKFHLFDPAHRINGVGDDGSDLALYIETGWPYLIDGRGRQCAVFEHTNDVKQYYPWESARPDDQGYGYLAAIDQRPTSTVVFLVDRRYAWEYELPRKGG